MACNFFDTKPLPETVVSYRQLKPRQLNFSETLVEIKQFLLKKKEFKNVVCKVSAI